MRLSSVNGSSAKGAVSNLLIWLVVVVVCGDVLILISVPPCAGNNRARATATRATLSVIASGLEQMHSESGAYPKQLMELVEAKVLERHKLLDGWKRSIGYERIGLPPVDAFVLSSAGADGQIGTPDDVLRRSIPPRTAE